MSREQRHSEQTQAAWPVLLLTNRERDVSDNFQTSSDTGKYFIYDVIANNSDVGKTMCRTGRNGTKC